MMRIGMVGLGLIGGSLAKAYKRHPDIEIFAEDRDGVILDFAQIAKVVDAVLTPEDFSSCDLILLCTYPQGVMTWLETHARELAGCLVLDCSGIKGDICTKGFALAHTHGFTFVGGHPMAGKEHAGFAHSTETLFDNAPMVLVPPSFDDIRLLTKLKTLLAPVGFGRFSITTAQEHDRILAFSSQLAHVVSNAYVKSPTSAAHQGFSAGSYRDLTRVAQLNAPMWTELFLANRDALLFEVDVLLAHLGEYQKALAEEDKETLCRLLHEGSVRKQEVDKT